MKKIILTIIFVCIGITLMAFLFDWGRKAAVAPIIPETSTNAIATNTISMIVSYPIDNQEVTSPIHITGTVSGSWFSAGDFPIELIDSDGNIIGTSTAITDTSATTSADVEFFADISYPKETTTDRALLLLANENPSGDSSGLQEKIIPLILK